MRAVEAGKQIRREGSAAASEQRKNCRNACENCRKKRIRCISDDGASSCKSCVGIGAECFFSGIDRRKDNVQELRNRIAYLEGLVGPLRQLDGPDFADILHQSVPTAIELQHPTLSEDAHSSPHNGYNGLPTKKRRLSPDQGSPLAPTYALGVIDSLTLDGAGDIRAYGPTSNDGLAVRPALQSTSSLHDILENKVNRIPAPQRVDTELSRKALLGAAAASIDFLPLGTDIRTIEHLLLQYYIWHHPMFPISSRRIFLENFVSGGRYFSPLLLNALLAVASHLSDWKLTRSDPTNVATTGASFCAMAKSLLDADLDKPSITTVQALCLLAKHEAYNGRALQGGLYMSMCGRLLLDLGLHLDPLPMVSRKILTPEDAWVRSRTFWGVWSVDKEYSALVGRPSVIRNIIITCPKPEYWENEDFDWWASYSSNSFVSLGGDRNRGIEEIAERSTEMAGVHLRAMDELFWRESKGDYRENCVALQRHMDYSLAAMGALPPISTVGHGRSTPLLITLHMVYNCHIIILNRPFLYQGPNDAPSDPAAMPRLRCYESALQIVQLMKQVSGATPNGMVTTYNCHLHNLITAAAILMFEIVTSSMSSRLATANVALSDILAMLNELAPYRPAARQAHDSVQAVMMMRHASGNHVEHTSWTATSTASSVSQLLPGTDAPTSSTLDNLVNIVMSDATQDTSNLPSSAYSALFDNEYLFNQQQSYLYPTLGNGDAFETALFFQRQMMESRPTTPAQLR